MSVTIGTKLGSLEVLALIGRGGMGEVYRARDTKLKRDVAIKILPDEFSRDADRLSRFQREAEVLASLNHTNIAAIHDFQESQGSRFLVLELVEGETLAERIKRGPIPVEETLNIAKSICGALEAAHEKGVVHRDLKPLNVMITPEGAVKVLDFGLAKVRETQGETLSDSPTLLSGSMPGVIVGTAAYMSPEQAKGKTVSRHADIWAFGVVLYEMLTGRMMFAGETVSETMAAVMMKEPDWNRLPANTPARVRDLLRRCLIKEPRNRLQAIGDARIVVEEALSGSDIDDQITLAARRRQRHTVILSLGSLLIVIALSVATLLRTAMAPTVQAPARVLIPLPSGDHLNEPANGNSMLAFSPDGNHLVYSGTHGAISQLFLRSLDRFEITPLTGTEGALSPFFSPDGQWVGFFAEGKLKKVAISGTGLQVLCDAGSAYGGSWAPNDIIYFAPANLAGLWQVSANGGTPSEFTKLDRSAGEISHRWPQVLPEGKAVLFEVRAGPGWDQRLVTLQLVDTRERRVLIQGGHTGRYVPTGHIVYAREGMLLAKPFDLAHLQIDNVAPVVVAQGVKENLEGSFYAISNTGSLAYRPSGLHQFDRRLVSVDRTGGVHALPAPTRPYLSLRVSPDGQQVAVSMEDATTDIWLYSLNRESLTRLTTDSGNQFPLWTPDGKRIVYRATRSQLRNLFWRLADGTGTEERLTTGEALHTPGSWSPDGSVLVFGSQPPGTTGRDIWILPLKGEAFPFAQTRFEEYNPVLSPDGHWLAYDSNESGRSEVYVRRFPVSGEKLQLSTDGGIKPLWARDGLELFYESGEKIMAVPLRYSDSLEPGKPQLLFQISHKPGTFNYDLTPDGKRFLLIQSVEPQQPGMQINLVLNWFEELKQKVPTDK